MEIASIGELVTPGSLRKMQHDRALSEAETVGVKPYVGGQGLGPRGFITSWLERRLIHDRIEHADSPFLVIDPRAGLRIVDANQHYAEVTMTRLRDMCGERMFDVFPDNPVDPTANGVVQLYTSLCRAAQTGQIHSMATQRYDVVDASGAFVERYWSPTNTPIYGDDGRLLYLLHHVRDVTAEILKLRAHRPR